jgi:hypothetical protein
LDTTSDFAIGCENRERMRRRQLEIHPVLSDAKECGDCAENLVVKSMNECFFLATFTILLEAPCDCGSVNEMRVL